MSILRKKKTCKSCNKEVYLFSKGCCKNCDIKNNKEKYKINKVSKKVLNKDSSMNIFEAYYLPIIKKHTIDSKTTFICEETGEKTIFNLSVNDSYKYHTSHIAHILPKSKFPTIKDDMNNCLILSGMHTKNQSHAFYDASWSNVSNMKIKNKAIQYIHSVMEILTFDEKRKARKILEIIENNIFKNQPSGFVL